MFKNRLAALTLAIGSLLAVAAPTVASAHDSRDRDDWNRSQQVRRMSERERRQVELQQRIARERWAREQRAQQRYNYSPYESRNGYYDRYGQWQKYPNQGYRY